MDFARKQLEKYGWTDGKGLGKHENGISQALKPKLKRSVTGIGHDAAAEFTEHWWTKLYNTAASNVEVKEKNGKTKKIKSKDDDFEITNSSWSYKKNNKSKSKEEYTNFFVKTSILTNGGVKTEDLQQDHVVENKSIDLVKLTDDELFAACEGRTAHKGARHGLKALGKLARIEMQEQILLQQTKYNGYSKAKIQQSNNNVEDTSLVNNSEDKDKKKKRKKKHCISTDAEDEFTENGEHMKAKQTSISLLEANLNNSADIQETKIKKKKNDSNAQDSETSVENTPLEVKKKKIKRSQQKADKLFDSDSNFDVPGTTITSSNTNNIITGQKRKTNDINEIDYSKECASTKKSKKKKCK